jgi:hypothetical protein
VELLAPSVSSICTLRKVNGNLEEQLIKRKPKLRASIVPADHVFRFAPEQLGNT